MEKGNQVNPGRREEEEEERKRQEEGGAAECNHIIY